MQISEKATCLSSWLVSKFQNIRSIEFTDDNGVKRKGYIAVAKSRFVKSVEPGRKYCLAFLTPSDKEYYDKYISFKLFTFSVYTDRFIGNFSYSSAKCLLSDFDFIQVV